ncbi:MAG TPA: BolA family protein [Methylocella sp.]|nr:BolA family protein [Methylocella sp.]
MHEQSDMAVGDRIKAILEAALTPSSIEVIDESHKHAGHAHAVTRRGTAAATGGTHFRVKVVSEFFRGKSRVDRHRDINHLLKTEFEGGMHALAIEAKAPGE